MYMTMLEEGQRLFSKGNKKCSGNLKEIEKINAELKEERRRYIKEIEDNYWKSKLKEMI